MRIVAIMQVLKMELSNRMKLRLSLITAALLPLISSPAFAEDTELEKILVTGDFQKESIQTP